MWGDKGTAAQIAAALPHVLGLALALVLVHRHWQAVETLLTAQTALMALTQTLQSRASCAPLGAYQNIPHTLPNVKERFRLHQGRGCGEASPKGAAALPWGSGFDMDRTGDNSGSTKGAVWSRSGVWLDVTGTGDRMWPCPRIR